ncbi:hypothetical protein [Hydrogenophaga sp.]|uniref:hypothetical protein n=1 Tax=Hydrogenophaga sp. TaxID=1904254 RepID=UPI0025BEB2E3|nr:hypothetical protein [Hydrogenophaga sp.]MBT9466278.1 hypothetical protein [Hydrogenophaga sp.]
MTTRLTRSTRPDRAALGMRWLVLLVILFGTVISSVGGMNSHGIAAIASASHADSTGLDTGHDHAHGHAHEDGSSERVMGSHGTSADHPHHGADHSHDKAHALPITWNVAVPQLPVWIGQARLWIEIVEASRLERPPMG